MFQAKLAVKWVMNAFKLLFYLRDRILALYIIFNVSLELSKLYSIAFLV